jgi:DNA-binding transcriptional ArsR family regulator
MTYNTYTVGHAIFSGETRFKIVVELMKGKQPVEQIAKAIGASHSGTSHQLSELLKNGLVTVEKKGRFQMYQIAQTDTGKAVRKLMNV